MKGPSSLLENNYCTNVVCIGEILGFGKILKIQHVVYFRAGLMSCLPQGYAAGQEKQRSSQSGDSREHSQQKKTSSKDFEPETWQPGG